MPQTSESDVAIDLKVLLTEPAEVYHAKAGEYLSSHQLLDFMACPWLYRKKQLGLIADGDTQALLVGRATHCRILEGRNVYESQFAMGGPINPKTNRPFGSDYEGVRRMGSRTEPARAFLGAGGADRADGGRRRHER